jgi:hypothetical protein
MARIVTTTAPKTGGIRKILFEKCVVTEIRNSPNGYTVKVMQKETPYYPPRESNDSFFTTGLALASLNKNIPKELEGWRPFESRYRFGYAFCPNVDDICIGMELPDNFHVQKLRTDTPRRTDQKPMTDSNGKLILIDGKQVYTTYRFLTEFKEDEPNSAILEVDLVEEGNGIILNEIEEWS